MTKHNIAVNSTSLSITAIWLIAACTLGGCMSLTGLDASSSYGCQAPQGVKCQSVSGTYYNSLKNNLPSQQGKPHMQWSQPTQEGPSKSEATIGAQADVVQALQVTGAIPLRSQGKVLGLWFKPWKDADGDLFDEGHVYVQIDSGDWLIEHVQRRIRAAYAPVLAPVQAKAQAQTQVQALGASSANTSTGSAPGATSRSAQVGGGSRPLQWPGRSMTDTIKALQGNEQGGADGIDE